jgi:hypothetical protein
MPDNSGTIGGGIDPREYIAMWWYGPDGFYHRFYDGTWHVRFPYELSDDEKLAAIPWQSGN